MDSPDFILTLLMLLTYIMVGLCLGSFSTAIAYRVVHKKSWIFDRPLDSDTPVPARSFCPECHHQLSILDLVPVFSWVFLGGKCRYCRAPISVRYPIIEACGAGAMVLFFYAGGEDILSLSIFAITLPFCLAFFQLLYLKSMPPFYMFGLFFSNILALLYTVV